MLGTYQEVSCSEWSGSDGQILWNGSCLTGESAPLWPAAGGCPNTGADHSLACIVMQVLFNVRSRHPARLSFAGPEEYRASRKVFKGGETSRSNVLRECQMKISSVRLSEPCLMVNFGTQHAPKHRWVHFRPLVHALEAQRK